MGTGQMLREGKIGDRSNVTGAESNLGRAWRELLLPAGAVPAEVRSQV